MDKTYNTGGMKSITKMKNMNTLLNYSNLQNKMLNILWQTGFLCQITTSQMLDIRKKGT